MALIGGKPGGEVAGERLPEPLGMRDDLLPSWLVAVLALVLPAVLLLVYYRVRFPGLVEGDALDFAQLGRNLIQGRGFVTFILRPLALTHGGDAFRQPELTHGPLFPLCLALSFGVLGARDTAAAAVSGVFYVLSVPVLYLLGKRLFNRRVGLVSAVLLAVNTQVLDYAVSGMHYTLLILLVSLLLLALCPLLEVPELDAVGSPAHPAPFPARALVVAGVLSGAVYLAEPLCFWFFPPAALAVFMACPRERKERLALYAAAAGVLALPWMWRNASLTGNPVFGLRGAELWMAADQPAALAYRLAPGALRSGPAMLLPVLQKGVLGLDQVLAALPTLTGVGLLGAVLPSLLFAPGLVTARIRGITLTCFFMLLAGTLFTRIDMPLFLALVAPLFVFGVSYLQFLADHTPVPSAMVRRLAVLLAVGAVYPVVGMLTVRPRPGRPAEAAAAAALARALPAGEAVLSDQPWLVAWHAERPAIWLPADDARLPVLRAQFPAARWLFLTPQVRAFSERWATLYDVFFRWSAADLQAGAVGGKRPPAVGIRPNDPDPLFGKLGGLSVSRMEQPGAPAAVLAAFPKGRE